jgi:outer membrane immunogenic protein
MKRILFAGAVVFAAASPALAADLVPPPGPPPQAPATYVPTTAPLYNWGGIYFGINGGYGFGTSNFNAAGAFPSSGDFNVDGGLVGGTLGANYQSGPFVFGIEGDADWSDISGSATCGPAVAPGTCKTSNDWLATLRGRFGYAFDRVLLYGTAGGAVGNVKGTLTPGAAAAAAAVSGDSTEFGWTAGAGIEFAITENITAKAEYLFVDLSNGSVSSGGTTVPVQFDANIIRAGLNFKFSPF